ncbi:MAG TPA: GAF domain-containing protein [Aggregatilineales bacterium]|nr:GAF domain-containing protein [Anaerolineales bacterium]HRE47800.1 GAF domain-containing protein [Aggregatilineales bacterium]
MSFDFGLNAARLLIVDDDLHAAGVLAGMLREAGFVVETAYTSRDALAASPARYGAVLVNGTMRDRDGRDILESLRERPEFSGLPFVRVDTLPKQSSGDSFDRAGVVRAVRGVLADGRSPKAPLRSTGGERKGGIESEDTQTRMEVRLALAQKIEGQRALSALGRSIASVLDLNAVLSQCVEAAVKLTRAEEGLLLLPDDEDRVLYLRAMKGIDDASAHNFRVRNTEALIGGVYRTGDPVLVADQASLRVNTSHFVKSLLYVPMKFQGRVIGVLGVHRHTDKRFTVNDQELLEDLAAYAAIAIENAHLYEDRIRQNRQLTLLVEAGLALNATLSIPEVLATLVEQVVKAFEGGSCVLDHILPDGSWQPLARRWQLAWRPGVGRQTSFEERPPLREALEKNSFYVASIDNRNERWASEARLLQRLGALHLVVLPIRAGDGAAVGVIELYYRGDVPEINQEWRTRVRNIALELLATAESGRGVIFSGAARILEFAGADWLILSARTATGISRMYLYGSAVFLEAPIPEMRTPPIAFQRALGQRKAYNKDRLDAGLTEGEQTWFQMFGAERLMTLPLILKDQVFGAFSIIGANEARTYRSDEVNLALALIAQAAAAIDNARLYDDLERSLSDLKSAQASLVQAARLSTMGQLAAVVAHQINNPLATVIGDSDLLLEDLAEDSPYREGVQAINRAGKRAHGVVKRLLSTARKEAQDDSMQWINVPQTIQNTLDLIGLHLERRNIRLALDLDTSPVVARATPGHLEDVWLNLLLNGRDALAGKAGATLTMQTRRSEDDDMLFVITISDNGMGIPAEIQAQIFEPFYTTKPPGEGTGLGLYVCKQIIEACGGTIRLESRLGEGTTFEITLPVVESPA